mmetsp:Transcript_4067/g.5346  ORF Transcript_4067/g.5346 Transcript_4067/m.5346 type:complete len:350 (+) Transcript_4067:131-1180(+)|eukprot:CAMPEP_0198145050 /NCGR_PEP_ID=MMETSP1443-20131203/20683_1 /TAXON_ID=186043 /ORGANISM="Entomoneis sp., Strain CCMP2396" /LENGTH=349 /DNA_ID=CAMNT_0043808567 /DNA_START=89 /DNA_END=1138 /DNA_ORIENTATION=-
MSEYADTTHEQEVENGIQKVSLTENQRIQHERIGASFLKRTRAYGKLILFGEHFVVYKVPALVGAVSAYTDCECEFLDDGAETGLTVVDDRPAVPNYKVTKQDEANEAIALVLKHFELDPEKRGMKLTFGGDLCCASGIGASAAQVVSMARALSLALPKEMTLEEINAAGYEGEKGYHGTPSGIDNTAATFGGVLRFQRTDGDPIFIKKKIKEPIRIVYASTGITASTTAVVGDVRAKKEADEEWFGGLLEKYLVVVGKGEKAIDDGDLPTLGKLLDENHALCQELTVSCKELDDLVIAAREAGAIGAKMSGTGRGGLMLALTPTVEIQDKVASALEKLAPQVWKTTFA